MATPNNAENRPLLPSERQPEDFSAQDRVLALYFRSWMEGPELVHGVVSDTVRYDRPERNGSPGFVSIKTRKTPDNRTGSFVGIDVNSAALIPEEAWPYLADEAFRTTWIADGSLAWSGEREMLEALLDEHAGNGAVDWLPTEEEHEDTHGHGHPTRAREHIKIVPGSAFGKVAAIRPFDLSADNN